MRSPPQKPKAPPSRQFFTLYLCVENGNPILQDSLHRFTDSDLLRDSIRVITGTTSPSFIQIEAELGVIERVRRRFVSIEQLLKHEAAEVALSDLVHDAKSSEASIINNNGPDAQLAYLREGMGDREIATRLAQAIEEHEEENE